MTDPLVRLATVADAAALEDLIRQLGFEENAAEISVRLAELEHAGLAVFVAEADRRVVGCLTTSIMPVLHRPKPVGRISMMVVQEGFRSRGIGAALLRAAQAWLTEQGCGLIEVTSNLKLTDAHRFYERQGFEATSLRFAAESDER